MSKAKYLLAGAIAASMVVIGPVLTAAEEPGVIHMALVQEPSIDAVMPAPGGFGTLAVFESKLTQMGKPFGTFTGTTLKTDVTPGDPAGESRLRTLVFDLPDGQIVAIGTGLYAAPQTEAPLLTKPTTTAIVGGTGAYLGAGGHLTSTRREDGSFLQELTILLGPAGNRGG